MHSSKKINSSSTTNNLSFNSSLNLHENFIKKHLFSQHKNSAHSNGSTKHDNSTTKSKSNEYLMNLNNIFNIFDFNNNTIKNNNLNFFQNKNLIDENTSINSNIDHIINQNNNSNQYKCKFNSGNDGSSLDKGENSTGASLVNFNKELLNIFANKFLLSNATTNTTTTTTTTFVNEKSSMLDESSQINFEVMKNILKKQSNNECTLASSESNLKKEVLV